jgi:catalase
MSDNARRPLQTHASGAPVTDNLNIQTAGPRGAALLQDVWLIDSQRAKMSVHSYHRDGAMRIDGNLEATPTYWPTSCGEWTDKLKLNQPPLGISGAAAHWDHRVDDDHWQLPGNLFCKMNAAQKRALFDNTARQVGQATKQIQERGELRHG